MAKLDTCEHCDGTGKCCDQHDSMAACDCDEPTLIECAECGGTGQPA